MDAPRRRARPSRRSPRRSATTCSPAADVDGGRYGLALTAGMLATVNPCGLPMLPGLPQLLHLRRRRRRAVAVRGGRCGRSVVALCVALGFLAVFAVAGGLVSWVTHDVYEVTPWVTVAVGVVLVGPRDRDAARPPDQGAAPPARPRRPHPRAGLDVRVRRVLRDRLDLLHAPRLPRPGVVHPRDRPRHGGSSCSARSRSGWRWCSSPSRCRWPSPAPSSCTPCGGAWPMIGRVAGGVPRGRRGLPGLVRRVRDPGLGGAPTRPSTG